MASLHEAYHGFLNDSTAFGTLLHMVGQLCRELTDELRYATLLDALIDQAVEVHESYATYVSLFLVGRGRPDITLLDPYPTYTGHFAAAEDLARSMPNPVLRFQLVQSVVRAAMQSDCLRNFVSEPPSEWSAAWVKPVEHPNARFDLLRSAPLLADFAEHFRSWSASQSNEQLREILDARGFEGYDKLIEARMDVATDTIGMVFYDFFRDYLRASGYSCLDFNGHQALTNSVLATVDAFLPSERRGRSMRAAPEGSVLEDLLVGFADERLVVTPGRVPGSWFWLDTLPDDLWGKLVVGATPHTLITVRPWVRVCNQYEFGDVSIEPSDDCGAVVALRRMVVEDGRPTIIEHALVRTPAQLKHLISLLEDKGPVLASCSMSVLTSPKWTDRWWSVIETVGFTSVLVDLNPFVHLRTWASQDSFDTIFTVINMTDRDRKHVVFIFSPETDEKLTFVAPCSSIISSALKVELSRLNVKGQRFREDSTVLNQDLLSLTLSHLLREEPWFDFSAG